MPSQGSALLAIRYTASPGKVDTFVACTEATLVQALYHGVANPFLSEPSKREAANRAFGSLKVAGWRGHCADDSLWHACFIPFCCRSQGWPVSIRNESSGQS